MAVNLKSLIGKLNSQTRSALEGAAGLCLSRTHYDVEIEHYLQKLLEADDSDFARIIQHFGVDRSRLAKDLTRSLDSLKTGNARTPALSPSLLKMFTEAWTMASIDFGISQIRTGITILALVENAELARMMGDASKEFSRIQAATLRQEFASIVAGSKEEAETLSAATDGAVPGTPVKGGGKTANLDQFTVDLTANARAGKIDPVLGRDFEIRQMIDILLQAPPEQSYSDRRGGSRKDRGGGGVGVAHRARRRAASAEGRLDSLAGPGPASGRRWNQRRIREPAEGVDRGGQIFAIAHHSFHR